MIKINRNYSNVDNNKWKVKQVHEHRAFDKNNAGYVRAGSFPQ